MSQAEKDSMQCRFRKQPNETTPFLAGKGRGGMYRGNPIGAEGKRAKARRTRGPDAKPGRNVWSRKGV